MQSPGAVGNAFSADIARTIAGLGPVALTATLDAARSATLAAALPDASLRASTLPSLATDAGGATDLEVVRTLGEGGMGIVELARQRSLGRDVAIKRLRDPDDATAVAALLAEATITGALEHPGIVPVHALGRDARGRPLMVMKKIEGVTLRTLLDEPDHAIWRDQPDRLGFLVAVARRVCDALALAHARGWVHRDVKPENVMLGAFGEVSLLDWGIAIRAGDVLPAGAIAGTPVYMAPEMLRPAGGEIGPATDVFLVGATLHECVTGKPPHDGTTLLGVLAAAADPKPPAYGDDVPDELAHVLRRAMHASPSERWADARALGKALDAFVAHRSASRLAREAEERTRALEDAIARGADPAEVHRIFHEVRFAFEHALKEHPEHERARIGRTRALRAMAGHALAAGERGVLASLLDALGSDADATLRGGLARLDRDAAERDAERARLRRIEADFDMQASARERAIVVRVVAAIVCIAVPTLGWLTSTGRVTIDAGALAAMTALPMIVVASALALFRRRIMRNRVDRQLALSFVITGGVVLAHRFLAAARGWSIADVASGDAFVIATTAGVSALSIRRVYLVVAALFAVAALVAPFCGSLGVVPLVVAVALSLLLVWRAPASLREPALGAAGAETPSP